MATFADILDEAFERLAALEKEALLTLTSQCDAVPYFWHTQERYPYWVNRLGTVTVDAGADTDGEELDVYAVEMVGRLKIGSVSGGVVSGDNEMLLRRYVATVMGYVNARELLQSAAYPAALDYLTRCRATSSRGYTEFREGETTVEVGTEIVFSAEFVIDNEQVYL